MSKSLRITSGQARGRVIKAPHTEKCRPTTQKTRAAVAATLKPLLSKESSVLDLFAGSGALGFELLSLGAASCVFVDLVTYCIEDNIQKLGWDKRCQLWRGDVLKYLRTHRGTRVDFILMDPPYALEPLLHSALKAIVQFQTLKPHGMVVAEHAPQFNLNPPSGLFLERRKRYGSTAISYLVTESGRSLGPAQLEVGEYT